ncbi:MAG: hypothetical protein ACPG5O_11460 [Pseudoalteromonas tetraodonis]
MNKQKKIHLLDALRLLEARDEKDMLIPCQLEFYTKDGEIRLIDSATIATKKTFKQKTITKPKAFTRKPKHALNSTRNIQIDGTEEVRTISIWLIRSINNMKVIL